MSFVACCSCVLGALIRTNVSMCLCVAVYCKNDVSIVLCSTISESGIVCMCGRVFVFVTEVSRTVIRYRCMRMRDHLLWSVQSADMYRRCVHW